jgi:hypothetical protein
MWNDYHESDGRHRDDRHEESAMVRREEYDRVVEELGEERVANANLQMEVEAWKYTAARGLKVLDQLLEALHNGYSSRRIEERAEALLREMKVYWTLPQRERDAELDALMRDVLKD